VDLQRDGSLSSKSIILQIDDKSQQACSVLIYSLQDRLSKGTEAHSSAKSRADVIYVKPWAGPSLKLIDLPDSDYGTHTDAILLVTKVQAANMQTTLVSVFPSLTTFSTELK
ncbi:unnamed protein product, partial [Musa textilis]